MVQNNLTLKHSAILSGAVLVIIAVASVSAAFQTTQPSTDTISALLVEVRALRIAMERSAVVTPRMQITMSRLNMQEQRTIVLSNQLGQIRQDLSKVVTNAQQLNEQLLEAQKNLVTTTDEREKKEIPQLITALKLQISDQQNREQQLRLQESEISQALRTEQDRWTELNARLDEMERSLGRLPQ